MYLIFLSGVKVKKVGLNLFMGMTYPYEFLPKIKLFKSCDQTEKCSSVRPYENIKYSWIVFKKPLRIQQQFTKTKISI